MKKFIKYILKKILNAGEKETVADAVQRKKYSILKRNLLLKILKNLLLIWD